MEYIPLHTDSKERSGTFLYRMAPGTRDVRHRHPEGEEIFVLRGGVQFGEKTLKAGDFLYSPPGSIHEGFSEPGCFFLLILPKAMEIVPTGMNEEELEEPPAGS